MTSGIPARRDSIDPKSATRAVAAIGARLEEFGRSVNIVAVKIGPAFDHMAETSHTRPRIIRQARIELSDSRARLDPQ